MREIVIDTETTGLDPLNGDRIVEIGAVALINRSPTGQISPLLISATRHSGRRGRGARVYCRVLGRQAPPQQTRHGLTILK
jgi:DNA polymerase III epsilon subunit-like protein